MDQALLPLLPRMRNAVRQHLELLRSDLAERGFDAVHSNARDLRKLAKAFEIRPLAELSYKLEHAARAHLESDARLLLEQLEQLVHHAALTAGPQGAPQAR